MTEGCIRTHATVVRLVTRTTQAGFTLPPSAPSQSGKPLLMDEPSPCEGERLIAPRVEPQKRAGLIEEAMETYGRAVRWWQWTHSRGRSSHYPPFKFKEGSRHTVPLKAKVA